MRVPRAVIDDTVGRLRACGCGRRECVVYWTGPVDADGVDAVVHPLHRVSPFGYAIDGGWLTTFWRELAAAQRSVRAQVHTHGGRAFHSETDDRFPLVHSPGFLSLVLPRFAMDEACLDDAYLVELAPDGSWLRRSLDLIERQ